MSLLSPEEPFDFVKRFETELHTELLRNPSVSRGGQEMEINRDWKIALCRPPGIVLDTAIADFRKFMHRSMGVPIGDPAITPERSLAENAITIYVDPNPPVNPELKPDGYRIKIAEDAIRVDAVNERGAMYALYHLEELMGIRSAPYLRQGEIVRNPAFEVRILRSYYSIYHDELGHPRDGYPEPYLARLSHEGINGIWLHCILRTAVRTSVFPELGLAAAKRQKKLNELIKRAGKYGIDVYLYLCEPMGFYADDKFWEKYPDLKGEPERGPIPFVYPGVGDDDLTVEELNDRYMLKKVAHSLCTSQPQVKAFLREATENLFRACPGLGGVILITASEYKTHCYSRGINISCPRCKGRSADEVVSEVITLIRDGVRAASQSAKVIVWNWSWGMYGPDPQPGIIEKLPKDIIFMGDFERGGKKVLEDVTLNIDEYCLSYVGPSERFTKARDEARKHGLPIYAKIQLTSTHELATVPYYPIPYQLARKFEAMLDAGVTGFMGCWVFGNYPSICTEVAARYSWSPKPNPDEFLAKVAEREFGSAAAPHILAAWRHFSDAINYYPFHARIVADRGPMNRAPAHPFYFTPVNRPMPPNWVPGQPFGDSLDWTVYGTGILLKYFKKMIAEWKKGIAEYETALPLVPDNLKDHALRDFNVAQAFVCHFESTVNLVEFLEARDELYKTADIGRKWELLDKIEGILKRELETARRCLDIVKVDSRIGYHPEAAYLYTVQDIEAKLQQVAKVLTEEIPSLRAKLAAGER